jgi:hypothetical protein
MMRATEREKTAAVSIEDESQVRNLAEKEVNQSYG